MEVASTLSNRSLLTWGTSLGLRSYALGSTEASNAGVEEAAPAAVFGLSPAQGRSTSTVAWPPRAGTSTDVSASSTSLIRLDPSWSTTAISTMITMMTSGNVQRAR